MIYTITCNPSLDYVMNLLQLETGRVNRTASTQLYPGGKGINVSIVLQNLGLASTALGFAGGFTGKELTHRLKQLGCRADFINIPGETRINVKLQTSEMTDVNAAGPAIPQKAVTQLFAKLDTLQSSDTLILAGAIPKSLPSNFYEQILTYISKKNVRVVVDATQELLTDTLPCHPFLIKPNEQELGEIFGKELHTSADVTACAQKLQKRGAQNVLVSIGAHGAFLAAADGTILSSAPPKGTAVNAVGAGDSMVAGFLYGLEQSGSYTKAFRWGLAAGSATAYQPWLTKKAEVEALLNGFSFSPVTEF